jgi:hypothetical protein
MTVGRMGRGAVFVVGWTVFQLASPAVSDSISGNEQAALRNFKYRPATTLQAGRIKVDFVGEILNQSNVRWKASICVRWYDSDGFEIDHDRGGDVDLGPGQSDASTGHALFEPNLWGQIVSIKAYVATYGCADAPGEAISAVLRLKPR